MHDTQRSLKEFSNATQYNAMQYNIIQYNIIQCNTVVWLGGVMVTASDLRSTGRRFDSWPYRCQVATLGKLFTRVCLCHQAV